MTAVDLAPVNYHRHELMRLTALRSYDILDTARDEDLDILVRSAARLIGTPIAALIMVDYDREWMKAVYGPVRVSEVPRSRAACSDVVAQDAPLVVADLSEHPRYRLLSWVGPPDGPRAFVGVPVTGTDGLPLGVLCALDFVPRQFDDEDIRVLTTLTASIVALLERRRIDTEIARLQSIGMCSAATTAVVTPSRIRAGLDDGEFYARYQPIVTLGDRRLVSVESLIRWDMPGIGTVTPAAFMPHLQRSPLLSQMVTDFMLHHVCRQLSEWRRAGATELTAAVNVTGADASGGALFDLVADALNTAGLPPTALTVELTETVGLLDRAVAINDLSRISDLGVRITLDDFGVGYSGLEFLGLLPVTGLKIDRSFVGLLDKSLAMRVALDNVVALGRTLGLDLVCEGVETVGQAETLCQAGVTRGQGYLYAQPMSAEELTTLLRDDDPILATDQG